MQFDEESVLLEKVKITDPLGEVAKSELAVEDQVALQAYVAYVMKARP